MNTIQIAIRHFNGITKLADRLGVSYQAVRKWERNGVPAERVLQLVEIMEGRIKPYDVRPDIYPDPNWLPSYIRSSRVKPAGRVDCKNALGKPIAFYPEIARFFGSIETSVFLCQFLYWREKVSEQEIYKTREKIEHEAALSHFQQREACKRLKKLGYLEIVKKDLPAKNYYRFHWSKFDEDFHQWKTFSGNGSGNGNSSREETARCSENGNLRQFNE
ncbi:transcriptional regulator [Methylohalobius crimeensis]|uniref:transcriptional regulator n=1 Tax=Methylohalobius crimeensis TaxID=244365 RepID=UPI0003B4EA66|nr:Cro/CI family transcriptional regulator [Methylohalobius crimeensis]